MSSAPAPTLREVDILDLGSGIAGLFSRRGLGDLAQGEPGSTFQRLTPRYGPAFQRDTILSPDQFEELS
ncbi:MAG: hypothetical protein ABR527_00240 [Gemmatimonadota bacterium]